MKCNLALLVSFLVMSNVKIGKYPNGNYFRIALQLNLDILKFIFLDFVKVNTCTHYQPLKHLSLVEDILFE